MRLFIAINLPAAETHRLNHSLEQLATHDVAVRWVGVESLHITLKFLGEVAESRVPGIKAALDDALIDVAAFTVALEGFGAFPSLNRPNIFWLGVRADPELMELHRRVDDALTALGFANEDRAYHPHVTLGRARKDGKVAGRIVMDRMVANFDYKGEFKVESVDLMRSWTGPRGARYQVLDRTELF